MKKVAVVLSGCVHSAGAGPGGAQMQCLTPDINQMRVVNHLTGQPIEGETRNVLLEAGLVCRGQVQDMAR